MFEPEQDRIVAFVGAKPKLWFDHTAINGQTARFAVNPALRSPFGMPVHDQRHDEIAAVWTAWNDRVAQSKRDPRWRQVQERSLHLFAIEGRARSRLFDEPAPDVAALAYKLELTLGDDDFEAAENERRSLLSDARRIAASVASVDA